MATHKLKTIPSFFEQIEKGIKTFEHRRNDRNYQVGDICILQEYDMKKEKYTGKEIPIVVTYVLTDRVGLHENFCIFSFKKVNNKEED